ncbi:MAG: glycosyltransferase, partial [Sulfurimonas sp.]
MNKRIKNEHVSIQIIAKKNGFGISKDIEIIASLLEKEGYKVHFRPICRQKKVWRYRLSRFFQRLLKYKNNTQNINIFLEHLDKNYIEERDINIFMPNPEWTERYDEEALYQIDYILCKTFFTEEIFDPYGIPTYYSGFTCEDQLLGSVKKKKTFFHLAGNSAQKGTDPIVDLWLKHPEWPQLTVVQNPQRYTREKELKVDNINYILQYVDEDVLQKLKNENLFHLCPSEAEGFGHYIAEGMSCGAIVLTTDAPPMNELITADRGILVKYESKMPQRLGMNYYVDKQDLERQINKMIMLSETEHEKLSAASREWYLHNHKAFDVRLKTFIE